MKTILIAALCCGVVVVVAGLNTTENPEQTSSQADRAMPVTVLSVECGDYPVLISGMAEARAETRNDVTTSVGGRVEYVSPLLRVGTSVRKGDLLVRLNKEERLVELTSARARLASARLSYLSEEKKGQEARANWGRSGFEGSPDSPLVFREPHIMAARADLEAAEAALRSAEERYEQTDIYAPYNGVVSSRKVEAGDRLPPGDPVYSLFSSEALILELPLSVRQWELLGENFTEWEVELSDPQRGLLWSAEACRAAGEIDSSSRMRTVFIRLMRSPEKAVPSEGTEQAEPSGSSGSLLPGCFLTVHIRGEFKRDILRLPEHCLTRDGDLWLVDGENRLVRVTGELVFNGKGEIYLERPELLEPPFLVALSPNSSYLNGLKVKPVYGEDL